MERSLVSHLDLDVAGPASLCFAVAVAAGVPLAAEDLAVEVDGRRVEPVPAADAHGTRLHLLEVAGGRVRLDYRAEVSGVAPPAEVTPVDRLRYLRPSRYCESDVLAPTAAAEFAGLAGADLVAAVADWVGARVSYVPGSSLPTDGAVRTLLARAGVCRDFAHLAIALLRALNVPARLAAVYAPGLSPMEYHAVCEALVDGRWWVVDPTRLAPRQSLVRISTGRDAADTAFLTTQGGPVELVGLEVTATVGSFRLDDHTGLVELR
jgi:transglutaminase-like putative cysteine protease